VKGERTTRGRGGVDGDRWLMGREKAEKTDGANPREKWKRRRPKLDHRNDRRHGRLERAREPNYKKEV